MSKKLKIDSIDESFIINSFRQDDTNIPPQARSTEAPIESEPVGESLVATTTLLPKPESVNRKNLHPEGKGTSRIMKGCLSAKHLLLPEKGNRSISARITMTGY